MDEHRRQGGQAIVLIAFIMVVLLGFLGLAVDGGRAYLDRRELQAAADAAALAAAFDYMNSSDYTSAEKAATTVYGSNERLYSTPGCSGYGSTSVSCTFGDPSGQVLSITVTDHSIAGVDFTATGSHRIPVTIMQVLGGGSTIPVSATATAVARHKGTGGAAIQTLSPVCSGAGTSMTFTGSSTTQVVGDIWSDGGIVDNGTAGGSVNGNVVDVCPQMPPVPLPAADWTVTGAQVNGWNMPDPGYQPPPLNTTPQSWVSTNGSTQAPGTYSSAVSLSTSNCYFLSGGVYDFAGGFKLNGGFISNELRPPDEPALAAVNQPVVATTSGALSGTIAAIPVSSLPYPIAGSTSQHSSYVSVGGQAFAVGGSGAAATSSPTSIPLKSGQSVSGTIPSGSTLSVRAYNQFWDANQSSPDASGCSATFTPSPAGSDAGNPAVNAQTWSVELTAVRWSPNPGSSCTGVSPSCYLRESAPSMCKTVTTASNQVIKIQVTGITSPPDPGAQYFNVYLAPNGACQAPFGYVTTFQNNTNPNVTINGNTLAGWSPNPAAPLDSVGAPPPDLEGTPMASGLPNANPSAGTPPHGDLANEGHCVDPSTGGNVACPSSYTPGAVTLYIPGPGSNTQCLNLQGGGDIYVFSGYQYGRVLLYEPGPLQNPPSNTCLNNVAGNGLTSLIGILYLPAAGVTIIGDSSYLATIAGGVIAWTATVKGNGGVSITADPTLRTWPSAVRLVK